MSSVRLIVNEPTNAFKYAFPDAKVARSPSSWAGPRTSAGLALTGAPGEQSMLHADVVDINGRDIARITWPPMHPGTASYHRVRPTVLLSALVLAVLLGAVAVSGLLVFRALRNGERVANHKAKHDALTGLWNRAGCIELLELALSTGNGSQTALHILDLDGFKPVNDAWGHLVGDKLIKAVAARLLASLPPTAVVARLGGDEFAVIPSILAASSLNDHSIR